MQIITWCMLSICIKCKILFIGSFGVDTLGYSMLINSQNGLFIKGLKMQRHIDMSFIYCSKTKNG